MHSISILFDMFSSCALCAALFTILCAGCCEGLRAALCAECCGCLDAGCSVCVMLHGAKHGLFQAMLLPFQFMHGCTSLAAPGVRQPIKD